MCPPSLTMNLNQPMRFQPHAGSDPSGLLGNRPGNFANGNPGTGYGPGNLPRMGNPAAVLGNMPMNMGAFPPPPPPPQQQQQQQQQQHPQQAAQQQQQQQKSAQQMFQQAAQMSQGTGNLGTLGTLSNMLCTMNQQRHQQQQQQQQQLQQQLQHLQQQQTLNPMPSNGSGNNNATESQLSIVRNLLKNIGQAAANAGNPVFGNMGPPFSGAGVSSSGVNAQPINGVSPGLNTQLSTGMPMMSPQGMNGHGQLGSDSGPVMNGTLNPNLLQGLNAGILARNGLSTPNMQHPHQQQQQQLQSKQVPAAPHPPFQHPMLKAASHQQQNQFGPVAVGPNVTMGNQQNLLSNPCFQHQPPPNLRRGGVSMNLFSICRNSSDAYHFMHQPQHPFPFLSDFFF